MCLQQQFVLWYRYAVHVGGCCTGQDCSAPHVCIFLVWRVVLKTGVVPQERVWVVFWAWVRCVETLWTGVFSVCSGLVCADSGAYEMIHAVCWVETGTGEGAARVVMCVGKEAECGRRGGNHARCLTSVPDV